jgi:hypothetical protein
MTPPNDDEYRVYGNIEEFRNDFGVKLGKKNILVLGELGFLSIVVYDDSGRGLVANTDYRIEGPNGRNYSGTTDADGYLFHPDVPIEDYKLTVGGKSVQVPVVLHQGERHLQRVTGYQIP